LRSGRWWLVRGRRGCEPGWSTPNRIRRQSRRFRAHQPRPRERKYTTRRGRRVLGLNPASQPARQCGSRLTARKEAVRGCRGAGAPRRARPSCPPGSGSQRRARNAIADCECDPQIVRDQDQAHPPRCLDALDQCEDVPLRSDVERGGDRRIADSNLREPADHLRAPADHLRAPGVTAETRLLEKRRADDLSAGSSTDQPDRRLGVCQPGQEAALRPAAADSLGAQGRPVEHRQADDAVARGAAIAKCRYRRRDSDPLR